MRGFFGFFILICSMVLKLNVRFFTKQNFPRVLLWYKVNVVVFGHNGCRVSVATLDTCPLFTTCHHAGNLRYFLDGERVGYLSSELRLVGSFFCFENCKNSHGIGFNCEQYYFKDTVLPEAHLRIQLLFLPNSLG